MKSFLMIVATDKLDWCDNKISGCAQNISGWVGVKRFHKSKMLCQSMITLALTQFEKS